MNDNGKKKLITSKHYYDFLLKSGIKFVSGVPCSTVNKLLHYLHASDEIRYIPAPREDIAISLSFGYGMSTGELPLVIMQNSGIGTSLDAIMTEPLLYKVPILMLITWRGFYKKGLNEIGDEPQHWLWGDVTKLILESIGIKCFILDSVNQYETTKRAIEYSKTSRKPSALLLKRNESIYEDR